MTIMELLKEKGLSRYSLSQKSGVAWATLADICSGKTKLENCNVLTVSKLAKALKMSMEDVIKLEQGNVINPTDGTPVDKDYLEQGLTPSLQEAIELVIAGEKDKVSHLDCLYDNLYGSINADFWAGCITEEQAQHLRRKYLGYQ